MKCVGVLGASGKMGQETLARLSELKIKTLGFTRSGKNALSIENLKQCDVLIDFSSPQALSDALDILVRSGTPLVSGTTGLSSAQQEQMKTAAKKIPILWSANMSLGIAVLKKALATFSALDGFDFQIEEIHHRQKKDSPSGTAKILQVQLQKVLSKTQQKNLSQPLSVRAGGIYGTHRVLAASDSEILTFEHQALNRKVFADGAIRAARWLVHQKSGLYDIESVLNVRG